MVQFKQFLFSFVLVTSTMGSSVAFSANDPHFNEEFLLKIIDEEVFKKDPDGMEWTENYGVQPLDAYEMDYSEKCFFIRDTMNSQARKACAVILN